MSLNYLMVLIQWRVGYIKFIGKKLEALSANPLINIYINRINYGIVFKINDGYKLELPMPEIMKLLSSTKQLINKTENGEAVLKWLN